MFTLLCLSYLPLVIILYHQEARGSFRFGFTRGGSGSRRFRFWSGAAVPVRGSVQGRRFRFAPVPLQLWGGGSGPRFGSGAAVPVRAGFGSALGQRFRFAPVPVRAGSGSKARGFAESGSVRGLHDIFEM